MQIGFHEFGIRQYKDGCHPVFAFRLVTDKPVEVFGRSWGTEHSGCVIVPMLLNPPEPPGDGWETIEYRFGKNKIAGYYRAMQRS